MRNLLTFVAVVVASSLAARAEVVVRFEPSKIKPDEGYTLHVNVPDGTKLDVELRRASLDLEQYAVTTGPWGEYTVKNNKVVVPAGQNFPTGVWFARFKPRGAADSEFSKFDVLMIDTLARVNTDVKYSDKKTPLPAPGSYTIYENYNGDGKFVGYSRIDNETNPCFLGGITMRFTKTQDTGYWNAWRMSWLRWCMGEQDTPYGKYLRALGGKVYDMGQGVKSADLLNRLNVTYDGTGWKDEDRQGLLGGWAVDKHYEDVYHFDNDMGMHYSLLPPERKIPANLSDKPIDIVELVFGHPSNHRDDMLDLWHFEALDAEGEGDVLYRYNEIGAVFHPDHVQVRWSVTEDWAFNSDGLITRIRQWVKVPALAWREPYRSTSARLLIDCKLIDSYVPDDKPLKIGFSGKGEAAPRDRMQIAAGESYRLVVKRADGKPYSGFLQIKSADGEGIWHDKDRKPIYVSNGTVTVGPKAYGKLANYQAKFAARPFLTNSMLNALEPVDLNKLPANASKAAYSNEVALEIK